MRSGLQSMRDNPGSPHLPERSPTKRKYPATDRQRRSPSSREQERSNRKGTEHALSPVSPAATSDSPTSPTESLYTSDQKQVLLEETSKPEVEPAASGLSALFESLSEALTGAAPAPEETLLSPQGEGIGEDDDAAIGSVIV